MSLKNNDYLMEHNCEAMRLDLKTGKDALQMQAQWAGLRDGMHVADIGCGSGITTSFLEELVGAKGNVTGVDFSQSRLAHAHEKYSKDNVRFVCKDIRESLDDLGTFDFIWARFFLEYFRTEAREIVHKLVGLLKPNGILCLVDLDHNCLNYNGIPERLELTLKRLLDRLELEQNFDPYMGRKLYSFVYDAEMVDIDVMVGAHHLIFGDITEPDFTNWMMKAEVTAKRSKFDFREYEGGEAEFLEEFRNAISDRRRFIYTPLIAVRGTKPCR